MTSKFSIQVHYQKKRKSAHWDLRLLSPNKSYLLSFAIPKKEFPEKGEKVLAIRTVNHKVSYMYFHGFLHNGDSVEVYDMGKSEIVRWTKELIIIVLNSVKINGTFVFIKLKNQKQDNWLILRSKMSDDQVKKEVSYL